jgi:hypothetical protein
MFLSGWHIRAEISNSEFSYVRMVECGRFGVRSKAVITSRSGSDLEYMTEDGNYSDSNRWRQGYYY